MTVGKDDAAYRVYNAVNFASLGDTDKTLFWLQEALRAKAAWFPYAAVDPAFFGLHSEARFRNLLSRIGLEPQLEIP